MAVIDIGSPAIDQENGQYIGLTFINKINPANDSGIITSVEIWAHENITDCEVATFFLVSGDNYSTRDYETVGTVTAGAKRTFPVNIDVQTGDFIGIVGSGGSIKYVSGSAGDSFYKSGDYIPCANETFISHNLVLSLYGTGTTEVPPVIRKKNVILMGSNF